MNVEDRLLMFQTKTKVKLEVLRKNAEEEILKAMQKKPKILKKSRKLAENHDRKLFEYCGNRCEFQKDICKLQEPPQEAFVDRELSAGRENHLKVPGKGSSITVESVPFTLGPIPKRKKTKSLSGFSFSEHKEVQNPENSKFEKRCEINEIPANENSLNPKKNPQKLPSEEAFSPQSVETFADSIDHQGRVLRNCLVMPRSLAPFQVKVSFDSGLDLERFLRRVK